MKLPIVQVHEITNRLQVTASLIHLFHEATVKGYGMCLLIL